MVFKPIGANILPIGLPHVCTTKRFNQLPNETRPKLSNLALTLEGGSQVGEGEELVESPQPGPAPARFPFLVQHRIHRRRRRRRRRILVSAGVSTAGNIFSGLGKAAAPDAGGAEEGGAGDDVEQPPNVGLGAILVVVLYKAHEQKPIIRHPCIEAH